MCGIFSKILVQPYSAVAVFKHTFEFGQCLEATKRHVGEVSISPTMWKQHNGHASTNTPLASSVCPVQWRSLRAQRK